MPKGLRILRLTFIDTHLTHFGGMVLLQRFCNKLRLRWLLQKSVKVPQRNVDYLPADVIFALLFAIMAGLRRIKGSQNVLALPHDYHYREAFTAALQKIDRLRLPRIS